MRTLTAVAAATLILLAGAMPASAKPTTRPDNGIAAGHLIREHACRPGTSYGGGVTGWLLDDVTTPRRELVYRDIDHAGNGGGQHWKVAFSCYR